MDKAEDSSWRGLLVSTQTPAEATFGRDLKNISRAVSGFLVSLRLSLGSAETRGRLVRRGTGSATRIAPLIHGLFDVPPAAGIGSVRFDQGFRSIKHQGGRVLPAKTAEILAMNMKMKSLSLAVLGLAGFAFAGSAMAACNAANLSAWTATQAVGGTLNVGSGGLNTPASECRLESTLTLAAGSAAAFVRDDTPANEARYRAQFLINVDALTGLNTSQVVRVFAATTATPANAVPDLVALTVYGNAAGTNKVLGITTADSATAGFRKASTISLTGITGVIRVEVDYTKGTTGSLKVWMNNTVEASPNVNLPSNNNAWGGVDSATLGLSTASANYRAAQLNKTVLLDQFDSRRQTFIGG